MPGETWSHHVKYTAIILAEPNFAGDPLTSLRRTSRATSFLDYTRVPLDAEDLDDVFAQLNHGSGRELAGYRGRSLSVGDLVIDPDGRVFMCAANGWEQLT